MSRSVMPGQVEKMKSYKDINFDDFVNIPIGERVVRLHNTMRIDPKQVGYVARHWRKSVRPDLLLAQIFLAISLKSTAPYEADKEAMRCIILADGISEKNSLSFNGEKFYLPVSFSENFPHLMEFALNYWDEAAQFESKFRPAFTVQKTMDLKDRPILKKKVSEIDYWPISFERMAGEEGSDPCYLDRAEIASVVIRHGLQNGGAVPRIARSAKIVTLGSCFAVNINNALVASGLDSVSLRIEESINTTIANRMFLERCLRGARHDELDEVLEERDLSPLRDMLGQAGLIVLTVGVAPIMEWVDSGRLCIVEKYRPLLEAKRICQRFTTVAENARNLVEIFQLLKAHNPGVQVCVTLSPVPLNAAVDGGSVIERDLYSKSILKVAIEEARQQAEFFYWPSFEAVKWVAPHIPHGSEYQAFGGDDLNSRHVSAWLIDVIVQEFLHAVFGEAP